MRLTPTAIELGMVLDARSDMFHVKQSEFEQTKVMIATQNKSPTELKAAGLSINQDGQPRTIQDLHDQIKGGDMDFDDISRVVPWIETAPMINMDINAEQRANPRGFKSHLPFDKLPAGARVINSFRNPADAAWSMFKFMEGWFIEPGTITPDEVAKSRFIERVSMRSCFSKLKRIASKLKRIASNN